MTDTTGPTSVQEVGSGNKKVYVQEAHRHMPINIKLNHTQPYLVLIMIMLWENIISDTPKCIRTEN